MTLPLPSDPAGAGVPRLDPREGQKGASPRRGALGPAPPPAGGAAAPPCGRAASKRRRSASWSPAGETW